MADANERTVAELQKKLDETKSFARMHIQNFKSQAKAHADELAEARLRATDAISAVNAIFAQLNKAHSDEMARVIALKKAHDEIDKVISNIFPEKSTARSSEASAAPVNSKAPSLDSVTGAGNPFATIEPPSVAVTQNPAVIAAAAPPKKPVSTISMGNPFIPKSEWPTIAAQLKSAQSSAGNMDAAAPKPAPAPAPAPAGANPFSGYDGIAQSAALPPVPVTTKPFTGYDTDVRSIHKSTLAALFQESDSASSQSVPPIVSAMPISKAAAPPPTLVQSLEKTAAPVTGQIPEAPRLPQQQQQQQRYESSDQERPQPSAPNRSSDVLEALSPSTGIAPASGEKKSLSFKKVFKSLQPESAAASTSSGTWSTKSGLWDTGKSSSSSEFATSTAATSDVLAALPAQVPSDGPGIGADTFSVAQPASNVAPDIPAQPEPIEPSPAVVPIPADAPPAPPALAAEQSQDLSKLSVAALKARLLALNVDATACIEKGDLRRLLEKTLSERGGVSATQPFGGLEAAAPSVAGAHFVVDAKEPPAVEDPTEAAVDSEMAQEAVRPPASSAAPQAAVETAAAASTETRVAESLPPPSTDHVPTVTPPLPENHAPDLPVAPDSESHGVSDGPLPDGWVETVTDDGRVYYFHVASRISRWERPSGETAERISSRLQADAAITERRQAERHAELAEKEAAAEAERIAAEAARSKIIPTVVKWSESLGWNGLKAMRGVVRRGDVGAPRRAASALLGSLASVPVAQWEELIEKSPLALPKGWNALAQDAALIADKDLKKSYLLAMRSLHPDKTSGLSLELRLAGEEVFTIVKSAWEAHLAQNDGSLLQKAAATTDSGEL